MSPASITPSLLVSCASTRFSTFIDLTADKSVIVLLSWLTSGSNEASSGSSDRSLTSVNVLVSGLTGPFALTFNWLATSPELAACSVIWYFNLKIALFPGDKVPCVSVLSSWDSTRVNSYMSWSSPVVNSSSS